MGVVNLNGTEGIAPASTRLESATAREAVR
jgi:hypothetical protein